MGRLLDLANRLTGTAVPSRRFQGEPLQPAPALEVPPVPSVLSRKYNVEKTEQPAANLHQANDPPAEAQAWLARVADVLGCSPGYLLERGFIDHHDLVEQCGTHPRFAVRLIRSHPNWSPPTTADHPTIEQHDAGELQDVHSSSSTASPGWRQARDHFHHHLFGCRLCYAPLGRYCATGADLCAQYSATPWS